MPIITSNFETKVSRKYQMCKDRWFFRSQELKEQVSTINKILSKVKARPCYICILGYSQEEVMKRSFQKVPI